MADIKKKSFEAAAVRVLDIDTVDVGGDLCVFRAVDSICDIAEDGERVVAASTITRGVVDLENRELLENNLPYQAYQPYDVPEEVGRMIPVLVTPKGFEFMRRKGSIFHPDVRDTLVGANLMVMPDKNRDLVGAAAAGIGYEGIVFCSFYDHAIVDVRGRPLPVAMHFDYMSGGFTNDDYDLAAVADKLSGNEEIEFTTSDRWEKPAPITKIPYCNASDERSEQVQFVWRPSEDSWSLMLEKIGFDPVNPTHIHIRPEMVTKNLDFFGLEQFRLAAPEKFDGLGTAN